MLVTAKLRTELGYRTAQLDLDVITDYPAIDRLALGLSILRAYPGTVAVSCACPFLVTTRTPHLLLEQDDVMALVVLGWFFDDTLIAWKFMPGARE